MSRSLDETFTPILAFVTSRKHGVAYLTQLGDRIIGRVLFDFYFCRSTGDAREPYGYFAFRFGQPRHLVALSFARLIRRPEKAVLDIACGCGYITRHLVNRAEDRPVIGLDGNFFMLYAAKNWLAREAEYVCAQADSGLPFLDDIFSTVFCSDAFYMFLGKASCIREMKRLIGSDGSIILASLCNSLVATSQSLSEKPLEGYEALVADIPHRFVANSDILARYMEKRGPSLEQPTETARLARELWVSLVASHRQEVFQDYSYFEDWPHAEERSDLNQLYREEKRDGRVIFIYAADSLQLCMRERMESASNTSRRRYLSARRSSTFCSRKA